MSEITVERVFGVSRGMILSYLERDQVDGRFKSALESDKHMVIYGSSKQGKSALILKHLNMDSFVEVGCTPNSDTESIYSSVLRQIGVEI